MAWPEVDCVTSVAGCGSLVAVSSGMAGKAGKVGKVALHVGAGGGGGGGGGVSHLPW